MPGRLFLTTPLIEIASRLGAVPAAVDQGPRADIAPGAQVAVLAEAPLRLRDMRWSMVMSGRVNARGRPVMETIVNARSETVFDKSAFAGVRRGVLPVNGWYEWTGTRGRKRRWAISDPAHPVLYFAAIWDIWQGPGGVEVAQAATLTCAPNDDVAKVHHRMPVILPENSLSRWLQGTEAEVKPLLAPWPDGCLSIVPSDMK